MLKENVMGVGIICFGLGIISLVAAFGIATAYGSYKAAEIVKERNKKNGETYI
jgi:hypothetical protein